MTESEFLKKWNDEKPAYQAWGEFVKETITQALSEKGYNINTLLKIPPSSRLKDDISFLNKAFYHPSKTYLNPYDDIEDKVGVRFVVLLVEEIEVISDIIRSCAAWNSDECKNFQSDREKDPLLFTYQSVHFVVRTNQAIHLEGIKIDNTVACEIQVRTLLQHAHSELTHDAIYKAKRVVQPHVHRTVAKSMALIETTDDFFVSVVSALSSGVLHENNIHRKLDDYFEKSVGETPLFMKSSIVIWDTFEDLVTPSLVEDIEGTLKSATIEVIKELAKSEAFYRQSVVLFICWLLMKHRIRLRDEWPLPKEKLQNLANALGIVVTDQV